MVCHMKTTLNIDDTVMAELNARPPGRAVPCRNWLKRLSGCCFVRGQARRLARAAGVHGGAELVDIADRDALYQAMEGR